MQSALLSVIVVLPIGLRSNKRISQQISELLMPRTIDKAVLNGLNIVVRAHGAACTWTERAMDDAAAQGRLRLVLWLHVNRYEGCSDKAFTGAAANGHLKVVKLLWNLYPERCQSDEALKAAASNGHANVVEFLQPRCSTISAEAALVSAAANGHLDVVRLLNSASHASYVAMRSAEENTHTAVLDYLVGEITPETVKAWMEWSTARAYGPL